ncbi:hypothetical protein [Bradyrhizobium sp. HKCCYLS2038]
MTAEKQVPVTMRALIARINRKLAPDWKALRHCRKDSRWLDAYGEYFVVDLRRNQADRAFIDPVEYGAELGVLQPFEEVRV